jgi:NSS family neurotransmitter:Na+ symporter
VTLAPPPETLTTTTSSHRVAETERWSSPWGFVLAATGAAIGLGNLWSLPVVAGAHGGGAFFLVYVAAVAFVALPLLVAELAVGRRGGPNPVAAVSRLAVVAGSSRAWRLVAWAGLGVALVVLSYYALLAARAIAFLGDALRGRLGTPPVSGVPASPLPLALLQLLFLAAVAGAVALGVRRGIQRVNRIGVTLVAVILLALVLYGVLRSGAFAESARLLFQPRLAELGWRGVLLAIGHACFTLSVGFGVMIAYGAYLPREAPLRGTALAVAALDTVVTLLAGLALLPLLLAGGLAPTGGSSLAFVALPTALSTLPAGNVLGALFFLLVTLVAFTFGVGVLEPMTRAAMYRSSLPRARATVLCASLALGLGLLWAFTLSQGTWPAGDHPFDVVLRTTGRVLMPLLALAVAVFVGWVVPRPAARAALGCGDRALRVWLLLLRWLVPAAIVGTMLVG